MAAGRPATRDQKQADNHQRTLARGGSDGVGGGWQPAKHKEAHNPRQDAANCGTDPGSRTCAAQHARTHLKASKGQAVAGLVAAVIELLGDEGEAPQVAPLARVMGLQVLHTERARAREEPQNKKRKEKLTASGAHVGRCCVLVKGRAARFSLGSGARAQRRQGIRSGGGPWRVPRGAHRGGTQDLGEPREKEPGSIPCTDAGRQPCSTHSRVKTTMLRNCPRHDGARLPSWLASLQQEARQREKRRRRDRVTQAHQPRMKSLEEEGTGLSRHINRGLSLYLTDVTAHCARHEHRRRRAGCTPPGSRV